jgi:hypothetical protein
MALALPLLANSELVALAWIRDIVTAYGVAAGTTLQGPDPETLELSWGDAGFVTALVVGGSINPTVPMRQPVLSIDCYATNVGKSRPPWGRAASIASTIIRAAQHVDLKDTQRPVTLPTGYGIARVADGSALTEPERRPGDEANHARYGFQLSVSWTAL